MPDKPTMTDMARYLPRYELKEPMLAAQYVLFNEVLTDRLNDLMADAGVNGEDHPNVEFSVGDWFVYYGPDAGWEIIKEDDFLARYKAFTVTVS